MYEEPKLSDAEWALMLELLERERSGAFFHDRETVTDGEAARGHPKGLSPEAAHVPRRASFSQLPFWAAASTQRYPAADAVRRDRLQECPSSV